jgi:hypothetical protein
VDYTQPEPLTGHITPAQPRPAVRVCRSWWLFIKLYPLVEHDPQGKRDFKAYVKHIGGKHLTLEELAEATADFNEASRQRKRAASRTSDAAVDPLVKLWNEMFEAIGEGIVATGFSFLTVPVWSWRKLYRSTARRYGG